MVPSPAAPKHDVSSIRRIGPRYAVLLQSPIHSVDAFNCHGAGNNPTTTTPDLVRLAVPRAREFLGDQACIEHAREYLISFPTSRSKIRFRQRFPARVVVWQSPARLIFWETSQ